MRPDRQQRNNIDWKLHVGVEGKVSGWHESPTILRHHAATSSVTQNYHHTTAELSTKDLTENKIFIGIVTSKVLKRQFINRFLLPITLSQTGKRTTITSYL